MHIAPRLTWHPFHGLPGGGPGLCFSIQLCTSGPHIPDVLGICPGFNTGRVTFELPSGNTELLSYLFSLNMMCSEYLFLVVHFSGVLLCLSGSCILELSFILSLS